MNPMYSGHYTLNTTYEPCLRGDPEAKFADRKGGFPHSEICGSKGARASPHLIAACHVLHRLSTPRHPLEALSRLIVLSKTHARRVYETPATCALYLPDNDVFYQVRPGRCSRMRGNPSFTMSTSQGLSLRKKLFSRSRG